MSLEMKSLISAFVDSDYVEAFNFLEKFGTADQKVVCQYYRITKKESLPYTRLREVIGVSPDSFWSRVIKGIMLGNYDDGARSLALLAEHLEDEHDESRIVKALSTVFLETDQILPFDYLKLLNEHY